MAVRVLLVGAHASTLKTMLGGPGGRLLLETATAGQAVKQARTLLPDVIVFAGIDPAAADTIAALADDSLTEGLPVVVAGAGNGVGRVLALGARVVAASGAAVRRAIDETLALRGRLRGMRA